MFTYTSFFLVSLVLAVVVVFIYKVVSDTRRSMSESKRRADSKNRAPSYHSEYATRTALPGSKAVPDIWSSTSLRPAVPNEHSVHRSHGNGNRYPGRIAEKGNKAPNSPTDQKSD